MKIFNSYTDSLEEFISKYPNIVNMYVCGPTVYNYIHIGNARPVVFFDTVRRYFESEGYVVNYVSNFTDVDDKIIQKAIEDNKPELELSSFYINAFLSDLKDLNCKLDYTQPKVTEYMDQIIEYIKNLIDTGFAYEVDGDVYFRISKIDEYGKLSNRDVNDLISGSRVEVNDLKENPLDFTLWKKTDIGLNFDSPFSKGRPGWHTECVVMIDSIFGEEIDIHGGGSGLKFPHHENEIAQAKATHNHRAARYWMHNGLLNFKETKMSKSLGNVVLAKDVKEKMALRYYLLSTHYRAPLAYSEDVLDMYVKEWEKLENTYNQLFFKLSIEDKLNREIKIDNSEVTDEINGFNDAMDNDFNTANAITSLQTLTKIANINMRKKNNFDMLNQILIAFDHMAYVLGFRLENEEVSKEDKSLYKAWNEARENKDFELADKYRKTLMDKGIL